MNNEKNDRYDMDTGYEGADQTPSSGQERRVKSKTRTKKKRKKKYYSLRLLLFVLLCVGVYFFMHSAVFNIEEIHLEKNDRFSLKTVKEITGLKEDVNMFEVNLGDCEDALEKNPFIREAEIKRQIPDTINISLELREPAAVIFSNKKYILIDNEGIVLAIKDELPHYTVFRGLTVEKAESGQVIQVKETKKYQRYLGLLEEMNKADLYFRRMIIGEKNVKLYAKSELYCIGTEENIVAGMRDGNLKAVLYTLNKKGVKKGVLEVGDNQYYSFSKTSK